LIGPNWGVGRGRMGLPVSHIFEIVGAGSIQERSAHFDVVGRGLMPR